jgi:hypothetical protein
LQPNRKHNSSFRKSENNKQNIVYNVKDNNYIRTKVTIIPKNKKRKTKRVWKLTGLILDIAAPRFFLKMTQLPLTKRSRIHAVDVSWLLK